MPSATNTSSRSASMSAWLESVRALSAWCAVLEPEVARRLEALALRLERSEATISFGGHFKSGKSTLLNALLGRSILPTSGLPETGAMCVVRAGVQDTAHVHDASGRRNIRCTTEGIRHEVSLTSSSGARRTQTHGVQRLEITLAGTSMGPRALWIDSPGINDTAEMTECARHAARESDVLLWVLSTRQFLSNVEMEFLAEHIAKHGPHSVALVVNAFLIADPQSEWQAFLRDQAPVHGERVRENALDMGFEAGVPLKLTIVAGRALGLSASTWGEAFGGLGLLELMRSLSSSDQPRVQRARLSRAARELELLGALVEEHLQASVPVLENARRLSRQKHQEKLEAAQRKQAAFKSSVERVMDAFLADWESRALRCGEAVAASISPAALARDGRYERVLLGSVQAEASATQGALWAALGEVAQHHGQRAPSAQLAHGLHALLSLPSLRVPVPDSPVGGKGGSAALSDLIGTFSRPPAAWASGVGSGVGTMISGQDWEAKHQRDALGAQSNAREAARLAASTLREQRAQAVGLVLEACACEDESLPGLAAHACFSGGELAPIRATVDLSGADEPGPPLMYQPERVGNFSCLCRGLKPGGAYVVRLHFIEARWKEQGARRFHVSINGRRVLQDYDIFARSGGSNRAVVEDVSVEADEGGSMEVGFGAGSIGHPQVCAVQIIPEHEASTLSRIKARAWRRGELVRELNRLGQQAQALAPLP